MPPPSLFCRTTSSISSPRRFHIKIDLLPSHRRAQSAPCLQLCAAVAAAIPVHHRLRRAQPWSMASTDPLYLCRQPPRPMIRLSLSLSCSVEQSYKKKMKRDLHGWRKKKETADQMHGIRRERKKWRARAQGQNRKSMGKTKRKSQTGLWPALTQSNKLLRTPMEAHFSSPTQFGLIHYSQAQACWAQLLYTRHIQIYSPLKSWAIHLVTPRFGNYF